MLFEMNYYHICESGKLLVHDIDLFTTIMMRRTTKTYPDLQPSADANQRWWQRDCHESANVTIFGEIRGLGNCNLILNVLLIRAF